MNGDGKDSWVFLQARYVLRSIMHHQLAKWIQELDEEAVVTSSLDVNEEASKNSVSFDCDEALISEWGENSLVQFLELCSKVYLRKANALSVLFYAWFDDMASQIRVSAISKKHDRLPFGCEFEVVDLSSLAHSIMNLDSGLYTAGKLQLWQKT